MTIMHFIHHLKGTMQVYNIQLDSITIYIVYTYSITVHSYDNYALYTPLKGDSMQVYNIQLDSITIHSVYLRYNGA